MKVMSCVVGDLCSLSALGFFPGDFVFVDRGCLNESIPLPGSGSKCEDNVWDDISGDKGKYCVCEGDRCNMAATLPAPLAAILAAILYFLHVFVLY